MSAWTVIAHTEVGSGGVADITLSGISGLYTDLFLFISGRNSGVANDNETVRGNFNGNTSTIYFWRTLLGNGSTAASTSGSDQSFLNFGRVPQNGRTSNTFSNIGVYIPNYTASANKTASVDAVEENNATEALLWNIANRWASNDAINSIKLSFGAGNFMQYSSVTLYGITRGSSGGVVVS